jgi:ABC-type nickel/cobalt efflux system permease component RcnA
MAGLAIASSLAQGLTAVVLVYAGLGLLSVGMRWAENVTNDILTPLSYAVIALIGVVLIWRGARALLQYMRPAPVHAHLDHDHGHHDHAHHEHTHDDQCGCGHRHGPTVEEVSNLKGWRDALALIAGIAIRPCTGAVIILVIAWQTGLHMLGFAAVFAMALGTGAFTAMVALASVSVREASFSVSGSTAARLSLVAPALQLAAGGIILMLSLGLLSASL